MYRLRTLGGAAVLRDGVVLDSFTGQRKLMALLALLGVAGRRGISRDRIAALLWSESDMERARGSLKQSVHVLRRKFGTAAAVSGTVELRLDHAWIETDVEEFLVAVEAGDHVQAVHLYGGPFLDGFHLTGAPEFEQWVEEQRAVLARHHARSLEALARSAHHRGAFTDAASLWRRLQAADPFSALAAMGLMEALVAAGERGAALRAGQAYETLMREELGTGADAAVTSLVQRLRATPAPEAWQPSAPDAATTVDPGAAPAREQPQDQHSPPAAMPAPVRQRTLRRAAVSVVAAAILLAAWQLAPREGPAVNPTPASVAVIPFVNTSDNAIDGHFADGLTDELISTLGRVEGMRVAARTSSFALKGQGLSARAFAEALDVATVIEGTVRRQGDRLKITAQLVDPADNSVLWSESFDRHVQDMIAVQEEIAVAIADVLHGQPPARTQTQPMAAGRASVDPEAYELYLRGRYQWDLPTPVRLQNAVRYHQGAVERDPSFAPAYAALAETYVNLAIYTQVPAAEALARASVAAERALALDPDAVDALVARAYVRLSSLEFAGAEADLRRAVATNPNYPWGHHIFSLYFLMTGRPHEAERYNRQALVLDPLSLPANATRGAVQAQLGNLRAAEQELRRALELRSDFVLTLYYLGVVQAARGSHAAALATLQHAARQAPDYPGLPGALAFTLRQLGRGAEADSIMSRLQQCAAVDPRAHLNLAFADAAFGRIDAAMVELRQARWHVPSLIGMRSDPLLAALRSDPRYPQLLQTVLAQRASQR